MANTEGIQLGSSNNMLKNIKEKRSKLPVFGIIIVVAVISVAVVVITIFKVNGKSQYVPINNQKSNTISKSLQSSSNTMLAASIHIDEVMSHLNELQRIATANNGTRAVDTPGFDATVSYISNYLAANTNYKITKRAFRVTTTALALQPILISSINNNLTNHTFSSNSSITEFFYIDFTRSVKFTDYVEVSVIPNLGCSDEDWRKAAPYPAGRVALVKRGDCLFAEKGALAEKYNVTALLIYNDGTAMDRMSAMFVSLGENNTLPALFLSYKLGQSLADAAKTRPGTVKVLINIVRRSEFPVPSENICADTPTGDPTKTIVIGSHSDSVTDGPGINDNGSGSAANLALAVALARLFRTSTYPKYNYRVRFCWWSAEELGLLGSRFHVQQAKTSTAVGERLSDHLINLNYDMLGSPNYMFGIYDGRTARNDTPSQAIAGSNKITALYRDWFIQQSLPWDYTDFSGRSDYGPFLAEGIVAGGLFSGADDTKTQKQRDKYDQMLGQGLGGISGIIHDPCYHKDCDSIQNINVYGYEKMVQAAAYALEYLGQKEELKEWLYPPSEIENLNPRTLQRSLHVYDSRSEYFGFPPA